jgi:molybdopterin/thiamine biosynthesis adenylyltransferase/rhodanese-related sulfurtransferase
MLTTQELQRYSRQILLSELGKEGQQKLKDGSVLVIGAGGLGSPALYYLAAGGVGRIGIIDFDVVDASNLQRQILFTSEDVGKPKSETAQKRLEKLNPLIKIEVHNDIMNSQNAMSVISNYDLVIDGSDNLPTRYLVNDACILLKKTLIYGAIFQFEGQVSVFNASQKDGSRGPNYRDLFPEPPPPEMVPSCSVGGVLGVLPGIIGSMQANEAIKILTGIGTSLSGRLFLFDSLDFTTRFLNLKCNPDNPVSGKNPTIHTLVDYEEFCNPSNKKATIKEISPLEVKKMMDEAVSFQLIDVREPHEFELVNIGGENIPLNIVEQNISAIKRDIPVVIHCKSGERSMLAIEKLKVRGFTNLLNMEGGIVKWINDVNPELAKY